MASKKMTNKEALNKMCVNCEKGLAYKKVRCPFRSISSDYCEEYETIKKDLKVLNILKKYLFIKIDDEPLSVDGTYMITLKGDEDDPWDYNHLFVSKEEKELLKEWLKNE